MTMEAVDATTMNAPCEQAARSARPPRCRQRRPLRRRRFARRGVLLGLVVLAVVGCGGAGPDGDPLAGPTVPVLEAVVVGDEATLVANVVDPDGDLDVVLVEWGDGTSDTVTSGFPAVRLAHTYTDDGDFTIVLEARNAAGQSAIATVGASITAFAAATAVPPDGGSDDDGSSAGGSDSSGGSGGGSPQPSPSPTPSPRPAPEAPEPEAPGPEPIPAPVTLDLLADSDAFAIDVDGPPPSGTGASAEGGRQGTYGFGLRTYAWHGTNGSSRAEGQLERVVFAGSVLGDMPGHVTGVTAEVTYALDAQAELKGPYDRSNGLHVTVVLGASSPRTLVALNEGNDDERPIVRTAPGTHTGTLTTTLTRDEPAAAFIVRARCTSSSGSQILAFFNEGYCDALERGGIDLRSLSVTFTPIIGD